MMHSANGDAKMNLPLIVGVSFSELCSIDCSSIMLLRVIARIFLNHHWFDQLVAVDLRWRTVVRPVKR